MLGFVSRRVSAIYGLKIFVWLVCSLLLCVGVPVSVFVSVYLSLSKWLQLVQWLQAGAIRSFVLCKLVSTFPSLSQPKRQANKGIDR